MFLTGRFWVYRESRGFRNYATWISEEFKQARVKIHLARSEPKPLVARVHQFGTGILAIGQTPPHERLVIWPCAGHPWL